MWRERVSEELCDGVDAPTGLYPLPLLYIIRWLAKTANAAALWYSQF